MGLKTVRPCSVAIQILPARSCTIEPMMLSESWLGEFPA